MRFDLFQISVEAVFGPLGQSQLSHGANLIVVRSMHLVNKQKEISKQLSRPRRARVIRKSNILAVLVERRVLYILFPGRIYNLKVAALDRQNFRFHVKL
jgi:hypothetical protein